MMYTPGHERRQHVRLPLVIRVHARSFLSVHAAAEDDFPREFDGCIHDLSNGGLGLQCSVPLPVDTFVCCDLPLFDTSVSIPTLMQVRWTARYENRSLGYIVGLQFVLSSSYVPPVFVLSPERGSN
jgi:hypothetical protein